MDSIKIIDEINRHRRRFFGAAAMAVAAAQLGMTGRAEAQRMEAKMPAIKPGTNTSFAPLKQIDAGVLNVGYAEAGPGDGPPAILLHGWPYDIYSFVDVAPLLASAGYRVIVPYLRGYGSTRFLSSDTIRNGQPSVIAVDTIAFMDALKIDKAILGGFDWGGRTVNIVSALWPERCKATVSAFSQTDFTEDLKNISVPVLVMHSEDDQVVPYVASGPLSAKLLKNGTLKTYKGFPHGMPTTQADTINADLLAFIRS